MEITGAEVTEFEHNFTKTILMSLASLLPWNNKWCSFCNVFFSYRHDGLV